MALTKLRPRVYILTPLVARLTSISPPIPLLNVLTYLLHADRPLQLFLTRSAGWPTVWTFRTVVLGPAFPELPQKWIFSPLAIHLTWRLIVRKCPSILMTPLTGILKPISTVAVVTIPLQPRCFSRPRLPIPTIPLAPLLRVQKTLLLLRQNFLESPSVSSNYIMRIGVSLLNV